ncbi:hypothetical protein [Achromobacter phage Motura]|uniref:Uncharacterized protein n=1 Tax=Achromobacter phage Motura TaxID=2591403 RepID=A0A514CSM9_9CAUD|nr:hypothetical protein H1O15_gp317 [Achromobacter phage Motura]QDH83489.1 hypothetical protein [Achromobacter phage Motura]
MNATSKLVALTQALAHVGQLKGQLEDIADECGVDSEALSQALQDFYNAVVDKKQQARAASIESVKALKSLSETGTNRQAGPRAKKRRIDENVSANLAEAIKTFKAHTTYIRMYRAPLQSNKYGIGNVRVKFYGAYINQVSLVGKLAKLGFKMVTQANVENFQCASLMLVAKSFKTADTGWIAITK